jgi:hypothetical protein
MENHISQGKDSLAYSGWHQNGNQNKKSTLNMLFSVIDTILPLCHIVL